MIRLARRYAELATTTNFSFLRGASHPEELVARAAALGLAGIGVADRNTLAGVVRAHVYARENCEALGAFRVVTGARLAFVDGAPDVIVYPKNRAAYGRLSRLLSAGNLRAPKGECHLRFDELLESAEGLQAIAMPPFSPCGRRGREAPDEGLRREARERGAYAPTPHPLPLSRKGRGGNARLTQLREAFPGRLWIGACPTYGADMRGGLAERAAAARKLGAPLLAVNDVLMHDPERRPLADVVACIREKTTLAAAGLLTQANSERHLKGPEEIARLFAEAPDALEETIRFLDGIAFSLDELAYGYPEELRAGYATPQEALEAFAEAGARGRYPGGVPDRVRAALDHELKLVAQLGYAPYFLTVHDIVRFARSKDILCQGRGSAANSTVCYCLGITEVDPVAFRPAVRTLRLARARRAARHRRRFRTRATRRGDPVHLPALWPRAGRAGERCRHLSHPLGDPRDRQGLRPVRRRNRRAQQHRLGPEFGAGRRGPGARGRTRSERADAGAGVEAGGRTRRLPPPPHAAQRRLRHRARPARRDRADHERGDGGSHDRRMGQERSRRARHPEDRRAGARHAHRDEQEPQAARGALRRAADARLDPVGRGLRLRDDPARRHGRRVPDREPRTDVDAAAAKAGEFLRPRHRGGDRPPGADPGRHGPSLSAPSPGARADDLSRRRNWKRCSARRSACRCSRNRR